MATYNVDITSKATRSFQDLPKRLIVSHRQFDPQAPTKSIKVITNFLHNSHGNHLLAGGVEGGNEMDYRYIRIIIDILAGRLRNQEEKTRLMQKTFDACYGYEGKKAEDVEVEVRIHEVGEGDVLRFVPK